MLNYNEEYKEHKTIIRTNKNIVIKHIQITSITPNNTNDNYLLLNIVQIQDNNF